MGKSKDQQNPIVTKLQIVGSVLIVLHLIALGTLVLAAPSGPWWTPMGGQEFFMPPQFAQSINSVTAENYLKHLRMTHNYHFRSIRPGSPEVELEARLQMKDGTEKVIVLPDQSANAAIQRRQRLYLQWIIPDVPVEVPREERIPAPGEKPPEFRYMEERPDGTMTLKSIEAHRAKAMIPSPMVPQPTEMTMLVLRSYARHLKRKYDPKSIRLIRRHWNPIPPAVVMNRQNMPMNMIQKWTADFGEVIDE